MPSSDIFLESYKEWIYEMLQPGKKLSKEPCWTANIAVGSEEFIKATKARLGIRGENKKIVDADGAFVLRGPSTRYGFPENSFRWVFRGQGL